MLSRFIAVMIPGIIVLIMFFVGSIAVFIEEEKFYKKLEEYNKKEEWYDDSWCEF